MRKQVRKYLLFYDQFAELKEKQTPFRRKVSVKG